MHKRWTENNVHYVSPVDSLEYGDNMVTTIRRQIQDSDFIVVVLDDSTNVSFELGMAIGVKKPIFILLPSSNETLPLYVAEQTYTIAEPTDYEKINYSFQFFLDNLSKNLKVERKTQRISRKIIKGKLISKDLVDSLKNRQISSAQNFEESIGELFKTLNIDVLAENKYKATDFQADFSLWIDELNSVVGNPIIVEAKFNRNRNSLRGAVEQLSSYLKKYNSKTGLLIYNNPTNEQFVELFSYSPLVLSISFQDLLDKLTSESLPEIILKLRNQVIHKEIY
jgi:nucleoside 2-deoxyribosyltransferase